MAIPQGHYSPQTRELPAGGSGRRTGPLASLSGLKTGQVVGRGAVPTVSLGWAGERVAGLCRLGCPHTRVPPACGSGADPCPICTQVIRDRVSRVLRRSKQPLKKPSGSIATLGLEELKDQVTLGGSTAWGAARTGPGQHPHLSWGKGHCPKKEGQQGFMFGALGLGHREPGAPGRASGDGLCWAGGWRGQGAWGLCPPH